MTYNLFILKEGARERFGDESFATQDSALAFALNYFPEHVDFEIEESPEHGLRMPQIGTSPGKETNLLNDERSNCEIISLCNYRKVKNERKNAV